ncbi:hypothetical protein BDZ89DRAFT_1159206 [Hymenopellis radicata]|nr:hypothetical protein BDZ89DRAFT_1159206 [Hymenopellis radicata]
MPLSHFRSGMFRCYCVSLSAVDDDRLELWRKMQPWSVPLAELPEPALDYHPISYVKDLERRGRVDLRDAVPEWPIRHMVSIDESELVEIDEDDFVEVDEDDFEFVEVDEDDFIEIDEDEFWAGEATTEDSQSESESEGMIEEAQHFMVRRSPVVFTSRPDQGNDRPGLREPYTRR